MKITITLDLSNEIELKEYNNIMANKDLIAAISKLYYDTQEILSHSHSSQESIKYAKTINNAIYCALADYNLDIRQF